jgi:RND family efflux transporter MFP subunit
MDLPVVILAGGELANADAVEVVCELEGQSHKIIEMLPEGSLVKRGQRVILLDSAEIHDRLADQKIKVAQAEALVKSAAELLKIQKNMSQSKTAQSQLALQLAELDKEKYVEGEYKVEFNTLQGSIALAKAELQDAEVALEYYRDLVKKGFRSPEELRAKEQGVERAKYNLKRDEEKLNVLELYIRKRQTVELEAKAIEAKRELERAQSSAAASDAKAETDLEVAQATAELERQKLARITKQLEYCAVPATADGTIVYAKDKNKAIEVGGVVHFKQKLFSIPNSTQMKVDAYVHESVVKKVRPGMKASIRIDAFSNLQLQGIVQDVATYYDSTRHWLSGGVKDYATMISLQEIPDVALRTGMTAQVEILVETRPDALVVPLACVTEIDGAQYCYVVEHEKVVPRQVAVGVNTEDQVEIVTGLREGEHVALDAAIRARAAGNLVPGVQRAEPERVADSRK